MGYFNLIKLRERFMNFVAVKIDYQSYYDLKKYIYLSLVLSPLLTKCFVKYFEKLIKIIKRFIFRNIEICI